MAYGFKTGNILENIKTLKNGITTFMVNYQLFN